MTILWEFDENILNKLVLTGHGPELAAAESRIVHFRGRSYPGLTSQAALSRPYGTQFEKARLPQTLSARILHGSSFPQPAHLFVLKERRLQVLRITKIAQTDANQAKALPRSKRDAFAQ